MTDESILRKFCAATTEERKTVNIQKYIEVIRIFFIGLKFYTENMLDWEMKWPVKIMNARANDVTPF